jgi:hypothetical protein
MVMVITFADSTRRHKMTTKDELIAQFKASNPTVVSTINGQEVELTAEEYEANAIAWAEMKFEQNEVLAGEEAKATARQAVMDRLGITAEEAKLLLS